MAAPWNPPTKAEDFEGDVCLSDFSDPRLFRANPTLASGDVKLSKDNGALANLGTLPSVSPASSKVVKFALTSTEMDADKVTLIFSDQTNPAEWADYAITIITTA